MVEMHIFSSSSLSDLFRVMRCEPLGQVAESYLTQCLSRSLRQRDLRWLPISGIWAAVSNAAEALFGRNPKGRSDFGVFRC